MNNNRRKAINDLIIVDIARVAVDVDDLLKAVVDVSRAELDDPVPDKDVATKVAYAMGEATGLISRAKATLYEAQNKLADVLRIAHPEHDGPGKSVLRSTRVKL